VTVAARRARPLSVDRRAAAREFMEEATMSAPAPAKIGQTLLAVTLLAQLAASGSPAHAAPQAPLLVKDINPAGDSSPFGFFSANGLIFFRATDGTSGVELWRSDGTEAGTIRVRDINPGPGGSDPDPLGVVNGVLLFAATDGTSGRELWKSDGTEAGTVRVRDINPGPGDGLAVQSLFIIGVVPPGPVVNGVLLFRADDGSSGSELWRSDGTEAGTVRVKDINAGPGSSVPVGLTAVGGSVYFQADDGSSGSELWRSDGTEAGTVRVKDINPGPNGSGPGGFALFGGTVFFSADDGTHGRELWKTDGSDAGTVLVKDMNPAGGNTEGFGLTVVGGLMFLQARDGTSGYELWRTDGTEAGTVRVKDINSGPGTSEPSGFTNFNGTLLFQATDGTSGFELWRSDGTEAGTVRVKDINPGPADSNPFAFTRVGGALYFFAEDATSGLELWKTDGTEAGTVRVADIFPGPTGVSPGNRIGAVNGALFFRANDGIHGGELWALFPDDRLVVGAGPGGGPHVRAFEARSGAETASFFAFDPGLTNGARVAAGDVDGDGTPDIIAGAGPGGGPHVRVFSGETGAELHSFFAYDAGFTGGVYVAAGDVDGDGRADIVTGTGAGGASHVRVFSGRTGAELLSFFAYDPGFVGGVFVAAGDVNGDGRADIVTGTGVGGASHVRVFDGATGGSIHSFFAYDPGLTSGARVAAGDVNGDGAADIVTGAGPGGGPHVRVFDGRTLAELHSFFAYDLGFTGGVYVGTGFVNADGRADILTGTGVGGASHVRVFDGATLAELRSFFAYDPGFLGGVLTAGSPR
jgi:ELWxxDGT repeat protein